MSEPSPDTLHLWEPEDTAGLWPLTATRPVFDLRVGAYTLAGRLSRWFGCQSYGAAALDPDRSLLVDASIERHAAAHAPGRMTARGTVLWWCGDTIPLDPMPGLPEGETARVVDENGSQIGLVHPAGAMSPDDALRTLRGESDPETRAANVVVPARRITRVWELVSAIDEEISSDTLARARAYDVTVNQPGVHVLGRDVVLGEGVEIDPGVVLDARPGPIILESRVRVEAMTHIVGPTYVGADTQLLGGRIVCASIGPQCRVGGEVDTAIFQGFTNKRHQGFLGHAFLGEWVNLGAMTSNSDLKNNYRPVRVWSEGTLRDTGNAKVGCFLGDHVKTGIGTLLTTGAVIGPGSNLFGGGRVSPRSLPGWSWWDGKSVQEHRWAEFLETARTALGRRGQTLTEVAERALRLAFERGPTTPA